MDVEPVLEIPVGHALSVVPHLPENPKTTVADLIFSPAQAFLAQVDPQDRSIFDADNWRRREPIRFTR
jgi:hypothetical protein